MVLKEHIAYGAGASAALFPVFGFQTIYFFIASVLIDADHYIDYLYYTRFRDWSVRRMFKFHGVMGEWRHTRLKEIVALEAFHTAEFQLAVLALAIYLNSTTLYLIFSGLMFHMMLDLIRLGQWGAIELRALSFVEYVVRRRKMLKSGRHPERVFEEAYKTVLLEEPAALKPREFTAVSSDLPATQ